MDATIQFMLRAERDAAAHHHPFERYDLGLRPHAPRQRQSISRIVRLFHRPRRQQTCHCL